MKAQNELICERCGYVIEGLPREGSCPECGRPIASSHPDHRVGSPWQRGPGVRSLVTSAAGVLRRPRQSWENVSVDLPTASAVLWAQCALAAIIFPGVAFVWSAMHHLAAVGPAILVSFAWFLCLVFLSALESQGVRIFGKIRQRRITKAVAYSIVGHAAAGWTLGAVIGLATTMISIWMDAFWTRLPSLGLGAVVATGSGLLAFEILTYLGIRRMRYANPPRPESESPLAALAGE